MVDDDPPLREALRRTLRRGGYHVEAAFDGHDALQRIRLAPPDVLVTDIIMPNHDGIELITAVRREFPQVKILAMSGRGSMGALDLLNLADMLGSHATLQKPLEPDQLLAAVAELLRPDAARTLPEGPGVAKSS